MLGRRKTGARWGRLGQTTWALRQTINTARHLVPLQASTRSLSVASQKPPPLARLSAVTEKKKLCSLSLLLRSPNSRPRPRRLPTARTNDTNRPSKGPAFLVRPSLQHTFRSFWSVNTAEPKRTTPTTDLETTRTLRLARPITQLDLPRAPLAASPAALTLPFSSSCSPLQLDCCEALFQSCRQHQQHRRHDHHPFRSRRSPTSTPTPRASS